jgi:hypothetical protein
VVTVLRGEGKNESVLPASVRKLEANAPSSWDEIQIEFSVLARQGGKLSARLEYRVLRWLSDARQADPARHPLTFLGNPPPLEDLPSGQDLLRVWDARLDLDDASAVVEITVMPFEDGVEGEPQSRTLRAGNTPPEVLAVDLTSRLDFIRAAFQLRDRESDPVNLVGLWISIEGGDFYEVRLGIFDNLTQNFRSGPDPEGEGASFSFSVAPLVTGGPEPLRPVARSGFEGEFCLRILVEDPGDEEPSEGTGCFRFDNNDPPFLTLLPILPEDVKGGIIPIRYTLRDAEKNPARIEVRIDRGVGESFPAHEFPSLASDGTEDLPTGDPAQVFTFLWDALSQPEIRGDETVTVLLRASDLADGSQSSQEIVLAFPTLTRSGEILVGRGPRAVTSADFDGDGFPDLLVANQSDGSVTYLRGGLGGLVRDREIPVGTAPVALASGDFNNDGAQDAVVVKKDVGKDQDAASFLPGGPRGPAPGAPNDIREIPVGDDPIAVATGHFDDDAFPDAVVANDLSGDVTYLRGGPSGLEPGYAVEIGRPPTALVGGDFDGDHLDDILVAVSSLNRVFWSKGTTSGPSRTPAPIDVGNGPFALVVGFYDALSDEDPFPDALVAYRRSGNVTLLQGGPQGPARSAEIPVNAEGAAALLGGDFDGDGRTDAVVALRPEGVVVLQRTGSGLVASAPLPTGKSPSDLASGDLDGDGFPDVLVANQASANVSYLRGSGDGLVRVKEVSSGNQPIALVCRDFNGDRVADGVSVNAGSNNVTFFRGGTGGLGRVEGDLRVGSAPVALIGGDFDGDGYLDAIAANSGSQNVSFLRGRTSGLARVGELPAQSRPIALLSGDFNGDRYFDLAVANKVGESVTYLRGGPAGLSHQADIRVANPAQIGKAPIAFAGGDFDGDGILDVAVASVGGWVTFLKGGTGGLASASETSLLIRGGAVADSFFAIESGDFDGDGIPDLAAPNYQLSIVAFMVGLKGFGPEPAGAIDLGQGGERNAEPITLKRGDFDGDGHTDLLVANQGLNTVSYLRGGGEDLVREIHHLPAGAAPFMIRCHDFDADGFLDAAVANREPREGIHSLTFLRGGPAGLERVREEPCGGRPVAMTGGDFDSDGYPDVAVLASEPAGLILLRGGPEGLRLSGRISALEGPVALEVGDFDRLTSGDFNRDGLQDLLLANEIPGTVTFFRQRTLVHHVNRVVGPDELASAPVTLLDPRSPPRYRLDLTQGVVDSPIQACLVPGAVFELPPARSGADFIHALLTDPVIVLRDSTELPVEGTLTLRIRDSRQAVAGDPKNLERIRVFRRDARTGRGEDLGLIGGEIRFVDFSRGKGIKFPIRRFGAYVVALERSRM